MKSNASRTLIALLSVIVFAIAAAVWWFSTSQPTRLPPAELQSSILPEPRPLQAFSLTDQEGKPLGLENLKGHWTMLFFGYTHCPDICPTTLSVLKGVAQKLEETPELAESTRTLFVSVDPKRDSPEQLKQYIAYFNPSFMAATGEKAQIEGLAAQVGAIYIFEGDTRRDDYIVNHTATIMLIDPDGRFYARFNAPHTASGIADTYRRIRAFHDH